MAMDATYDEQHLRVVAPMAETESLSDIASVISSASGSLHAAEEVASATDGLNTESGLDSGAAFSGNASFSSPKHGLNALATDDMRVPG